MAEANRPSKYSSAFLTGVSQACAFAAAPMLTASTAMTIGRAMNLGSWLGTTPAVMAGIFATGVTLAGTAIVTNYKANKQRRYEQSSTIEHCMEHALGTHPVDLTLSHGLAPEHDKNWTQYVTEKRAANTEIAR
jgi:hypothetical protein